ncbi:MAG: HAD-IIA family hydrolase [Pseudomonadota bacterium]
MSHLERLRAARAFILDMDGTLYVDEQPLPGAQKLLGELAARGIPHLFLTNNSSRRASEYQARLERMQIPAKREQVLTSGDATISHLLEETPYRSAYLLGTPALEEEFRQAGIALDRPDPECVVVGFDQTLTYAKLRHACRLLFAGKPFYATHPDKTCITKDGLIPDIAAITAALETVTGRQPKIVGKPYPEIAREALRKLGAVPAGTVFIGDQLDTDMQMAKASDLLGILVLSGETKRAAVDALLPDQRPPLVAENVAEVVRWLGW